MMFPILRRVPGADEADGLGHAFLESHMRLVGELDSPLTRRQKRPVCSVVCFNKLLSHPRLADHALAAHGGQHLQHRRHIVHQRNIHRLDLRPERKAAIRDDQRVGVPHPGEEIEDVGVQDSSLGAWRSCSDEPDLAQSENQSRTANDTNHAKGQTIKPVALFRLFCVFRGENFRCSNQNPRNRRRQVTRQQTADHRAQAELRQIRPAVGASEPMPPIWMAMLELSSPKPHSA